MKKAEDVNGVLGLEILPERKNEEDERKMKQ